MTLLQLNSDPVVLLVKFAARLDYDRTDILFDTYFLTWRYILLADVGVHHAG